MKYWLITILVPNAMGRAHFANAVIDFSPSLITNRWVIINSIEIGEREYDESMRQSEKRYPKQDIPGLLIIETSTT